MSIKGILFDKDGTLIDFYSLWLMAAKDAIPRLVKTYNIRSSKSVIEGMLKCIGVFDDRVEPNGPLAYMTYDQIGSRILHRLHRYGYFPEADSFKESVKVFFQDAVTGKNVKFKTFTNVNEMTENLRKRDIKIGMVTADTLLSAKDCLDKIEAIDGFDYIAGDDGKTKPKPDAETFERFLQEFGLKKEEVAVVGDTYNDVRFAKENGGTAIAVLSGVSNEKDFKNCADYIIGSVDELVDLVDRINFM